MLSLGMYWTAGVGGAALLLGLFLSRKVPILKRFCIPPPVSGGLLVSMLFLLLHLFFSTEISFDGTIREICMMIFFTSVGFQCDLSVIRKGGRPLLVMIGLVALLIVLQNLLSVGIARAMNLSPLVGMGTGSIPMAGGHGTAGGFAPILRSMGLEGADSISLAAATFGLVAGSLAGGPLGERLIRRHRLSQASDRNFGPESLEGDDAPEGNALKKYTLASCQLLLTMAAGMGLSKILTLCGITAPSYFGALIAASAFRNIARADGKKKDFICRKEIAGIGQICLSLFLGMAMATLKLWELAGLMLPLLVILLSQTALVVLFASFAAFPALGKDYDAAVLVSGLCGFGLGATPNAMANMSAVCDKYHYCVKPFIIVPVIGAMFVDLINTGVITLFLNLI